MARRFAPAVVKETAPPKRQAKVSKPAAKEPAKARPKKGTAATWKTWRDRHPEEWRAKQRAAAKRYRAKKKKRAKESDRGRV